jgi:hypothetical protein
MTAPVIVVSILKFLHVTAAFAAVSIQLGSDLLFQRVVGLGDPGAVVRLGQAIRRRRPLEGAIIEVAIVLGLITGFLGGFNLLAPWLLLAYLDVVVLTVIAFRWAAPAFSAILEAAGAGDAAEMQARSQAPRRRWSLTATAALFGALIFLMVVKPLA